MPLLKFSTRIALALGILIVLGVVTSPVLFWGWGGVVAVLVLQAGTAWALKSWICRHLESHFQDFSNVLTDLKQNLPTGTQGLVLKSQRADDLLGRMAVQINEQVEEYAAQTTRLLEINRDLEQNRALFQSILGTMVEGVLVLDSQRRILFFNDTARRMLDCTTRNVAGRPLWEVIRLPDLAVVVDSIYDASQAIRRELELLRSRCVVEISAAPLPLHSGTGAVLVLHDVTEVRRLERMRREFVSNVSHELKTPLTSIQVYADTLLDDDGGDLENRRLFLTRILEQSHRLQQLIQDMLRLARIESHSEAFHLAPVVVQRVLDKSADARRGIADSKQVRLILSATAPDAKAYVDAGGLQTIFDNLISNAIHYTPTGGQVQISCQVVNDQVEVAVVDNGIGIPTEHLGRIFERFYRIDKARTSGQGGTGLGLAIVKHLVAEFQGEIDVQSEPGQGSRFTVRFPVLQD